MTRKHSITVRNLFVTGLTLILINSISGCATTTEVIKSIEFANQLEDILESQTEIPVDYLKSEAYRPLPPAPSLAFDLAIQKIAFASLILGDHFRVRRAVELAATNASLPSTFANVLNTAALAEEFAGNYETSIGMKEAALEKWRSVTKKRSRTQTDDLSRLNSLFDIGLAASRLADYRKVQKTIDELHVLAADEDAYDYARTMASLAIDGFKATTIGERDGDYNQAYNKLLSVRERFNDLIRQSSDRTTSATYALLAEIHSGLSYYALASGNHSIAATHIAEMNNIAHPVAVFSIANSRIRYLESIGNYTEALKILESKQAQHPISLRWLAPSLRRATHKASLLSALGRWRDAYETLDSFRNARDLPSSTVRSEYLGMLALTAEMANIPGTEHDLFLRNSQQYNDLPNSDHYLRYYAIRTIIQYRRGARIRSARELSEAVLSGQKLSNALRTIRSRGDRVGLLAPTWLVKLAKISYAKAAVETGKIGEDQYDNILQAAMLLQLSDLDSDISYAAVRRTTIPGVTANQLHQLQELQLQSRSAQRRFISLVDSFDADPTVIRELAQQANFASVKLNRLTLEIGKTAPSLAETLQGTLQISAADLQGKLNVNEGLAIVAPLDDKSSLAIFATRHSFRYKILPTGNAGWAEYVARIRTSIKFDTSGPAQAFAVADSHNAYNLLFGWLDNAISKVQKLTVIAGGPLAGIPFSLLLKSPPKTESFTNYKALDWLINSVAIAHAPTLSSWYALRSSRDRHKNAGGFHAWANPDFDGIPDNSSAEPSCKIRRSIAKFKTATPIAERMGYPNLGALLMPLPETLAEAQTIARLLGSEPARNITSGSDATRTSVINRFRDAETDAADILMFATHTLSPAVIPEIERPALALASEPGTSNPSMLTLDDIVGLTIDAKLVILSACNTAEPEFVRGDPLSGLVRSFLFAGARSLLVTHWDVETCSAAEITTRTVGALVKHPEKSYAFALQVAAKAMIQAIDTPVEWTHPAYWAPFALIGDGET